MIDDFLNFLKSLDLYPINPSIIVDDNEQRRFTPVGVNQSKKPCIYQLSSANGFWFGRVHDFRTGETHKYSSKTKKSWTEQERKAFLEARLDHKKKSLEEDVLKKATAAKKAKQDYQNAKICTSHLYAQKKGLILDNLKVLGDDLVIPIYSDGQIVNLQTISPDGFKMFSKDAEIKGCYGIIFDKKMNRDIIIVCEGYATGDSLFQSLNLPVVVAFNAGNLKAVCFSIRKKYPNSKIIIAADNDQWTIVRGKPLNVGIEKANEAAVAIGGAHVVVPNISEDDYEKRTDFNDIFLTEGADSVKVHFDGAINDHVVVFGSAVESIISDDCPINFYPEIDISQEDYNYYFNAQPAYMDEVYAPVHDSYVPKNMKDVGEDWKSKIIYDSKGFPDKTSISNLKLYLSYHEKIKGLFYYDSFSHKITLLKCPPWEDEKYFSIREYNEDDISNLRVEIENLGLRPKKSDITDCVKLVAMENKINPAQKYFENLNWDGKKRLDNFLEYYFCANPNPNLPEEDPNYLSCIGKKWMVAAVKRVFEAGCKFDNMLVIEGEQGIGKSRALRVLCTFGKDEERAYFTDSVRFSEISKPDTVQKMWGCLIIEIAELSGLSKSDVNSVKNWITNQEDLARLPYDRLVQKFKRQCVFAGTTNNYDYLTDTTGNRRFWCFKSHDIAFDEIERDRDQLWAEAYVLYKEKFPIWLNADEARLADKAQHKRLSSDPWESSVDDLAVGYGDVGFKVKDVLSDLGIAIKDQKTSDAARVRGILEKLGYHPCTFIKHNKRHRGYRKMKGLGI